MRTAQVPSAPIPRPDHKLPNSALLVIALAAALTIFVATPITASAAFNIPSYTGGVNNTAAGANVSYDTGFTRSGTDIEDLRQVVFEFPAGSTYSLAGVSRCSDVSYALNTCATSSIVGITTIRMFRTNTNGSKTYQNVEGKAYAMPNGTIKVRYKYPFNDTADVVMTIGTSATTGGPTLTSTDFGRNISTDVFNSDEVTFSQINFKWQGKSGASNNQVSILKNPIACGIKQHKLTATSYQGVSVSRTGSFSLYPCSLGDTTRPVVSIVEPSNGEKTGSPTTQLSFTASDNGTLPENLYCTFSINGGPAEPIAVGNFTVEDVALSMGANSIAVTCRDIVNNLATSTPVVVTRGTAAAVNVNGTDQKTSASSFEVDYSASGTAPVACVVSNTTNGGALGNPVSLVAGPNVIEVTCDNDFGPPAIDSVTITQGSAPAVSIITGSRSTTNPAIAISYSSTGTAPVVCEVVNGQHSGNPISLNFGPNTVTVTCDNGYGAPAVDTVEINRVMPETTITEYGNPSAGGTAAPALSVEFTSSTASSTHECAVADAPNGSASYDSTDFDNAISPVDWVSCTSGWQVPTSALTSERQYMYLIRVVDGGSPDLAPAKGFFWFDARPFSIDPSIAAFTNSLVGTQAGTDDARAHPTLEATLQIEGADDGKSLDLVLPDGLMASIAAVPGGDQCDLTLFESLGTCPASSKIGTVSGSAIGSVDGNLAANGDLYLVEPDSLGNSLPGAAAGIAMVIDEIDGPVTDNPGTVVALGGIYFNDNAMNVRLKFDDIPSETTTGLRFHALQLSLKLDGDTRPDMGSPASSANPALIANPSQCVKMLVPWDAETDRTNWNRFQASAHGHFGAVTPNSTADYPVNNCEGLPEFEPTVTTSTYPSPISAGSGDIVLANRIGFEADQSGYFNAIVHFPPYLTLDGYGGIRGPEDQCSPLTAVWRPDGTRRFDPTVDRGCPPQARVGTAEIQTPLFDETIRADVWLIENGVLPYLGIYVDEETPGNPRGLEIGLMMGLWFENTNDRAYPTSDMLAASGYVGGDGGCVVSHNTQRISRCQSALTLGSFSGSSADLPLTSLDLNIGNVDGRIGVGGFPMTSPIRAVPASDPSCRTEFYPGGVSTDPYTPVTTNFFDSAAQLGAWSGETAPETTSEVPITGCAQVLRPPALSTLTKANPTSGTVTFNYTGRVVAVGLSTECQRDGGEWSAASCGTVTGTATGTFDWTDIASGSGSHTFKVRTRDDAGNLSSEKSVTWTA